MEWEKFNSCKASATTNAENIKFMKTISALIDSKTDMFYYSDYLTEDSFNAITEFLQTNYKYNTRVKYGRLIVSFLRTAGIECPEYSEFVAKLRVDKPAISPSRATIDIQTTVDGLVRVIEGTGARQGLHIRIVAAFVLYSPKFKMSELCETTVGKQDDEHSYLEVDTGTICVVNKYGMVTRQKLPEKLKTTLIQLITPEQKWLVDTGYTGCTGYTGSGQVASKTISIAFKRLFGKTITTICDGLASLKTVDDEQDILPEIYIPVDQPDCLPPNTIAKVGLRSKKRD